MKRLATIIGILILTQFAAQLMAQTAIFEGSLFTNNNEASVRSGGEFLQIAIDGDTLESTLGEDNPYTTSLISSISGTGDWSTVLSELDFTNVVRLSDTLVRINLPAVPDYDIYANETVSVDIDAFVLVTSVVNLAAGPDLTINHDIITPSIGGTILLGVSESDIRQNSYTLTITVTNDTLESTVGEDNAITTAILDNISGNQNWTDIRSDLDFNDLERTDANTITITIPAVPSYFIESNETVGLSLPATALQNGSYSLNPSTTFSISNEGVSLDVSGSITSSAGEQDIHDGGKTIILALTGDEWVDDIATVEGTADLLFAGISSGSEWDAEVTPSLNAIHITRDSETQVSIVLPAVGSYDINLTEVVSILVPNAVLKHTSSGTVSGTPSFSITPLSGEVSITGTIFDGSKDKEVDIKGGGPTIILSISEGYWEGDIGAANNTSTLAIISSITGNRDWATVSAAMDYTDISLDDSQTISITVPASGYNIYSDETLTINVQADAIQATSSDILASPTLLIQHDPLSAVLEGSVLSSKNESAILAGGDSIVLKLRNDIWAPTMGEDNSITSDLLSGITGDQSWSLISFDYTDVFRRNDSTVSIIVPLSTDYYIGNNETVSINIPAIASANTNYSVAPLPSTFSVVNESVSFTLSGDLVTGLTETDIRTGGKTLTITVNGDQWVNPIDVDLATADLLFDEISGSASWNSAVSGYGLVNINLDDPNTLSLVFPAAASYDINLTDFININIVSDILKTTSSGTFLIDSAFYIEPLDASISTSGNIQSGIYNKEDSIRAGGGQIVYTLTEDEWASNIGDGILATVDLINGISGSTEWETKVKPGIIGGDQGDAHVNVVGQVLTITLPDVAAYNILTEDILTCEIPFSSLMYKSSGSVTSLPVISILPAPPEIFINDPGLDELTLNGSVLTISLKDDTFKDPGLIVSNFSSSKSPTITIGEVLYNSPTSVDVTLAFSSDFDSDINDFSISIDASELSSGVPLTSNNIPISSQKEPEVFSVSISDATYIINDVVRADIVVVDDQSAVYDYVSGRIAGRLLDSLKRVNNTLYYGYFTVTSDSGDYSAADDIPVSGLQLNNLPLIGEIYNGIATSSAVIDASKPKINYMQVSGNAKKIGDQIEIIISADGNDYTAIAPTSVNTVGIPGVSIQNLGNGVYILNYTISENNFDVPLGTLTAQITMVDQAGNESDTYSILSANTISIDANPPHISSIRVPDGNFSIDDVIEIVVNTDGDDYNFELSTEVNGIPYYASSLNGLSTGPGEYTLYYTVKSLDPEVDPGMLEVKVRMTDQAGNNSTLFEIVELNSLAIYTVLPTASVAGSFDICEDDSVKVVVNLTGRFPMELYSFDGSVTRMHSGILSSPYSFYENPSASKNFRIDSVLDFNGIKNIGTGLVEVNVNDKTFVEFENLTTSYSLEDDPVVLEANVMGGIFSGPGVISSGGTFNPGIADTTNSPHTLYYEYTNSEGCISYDSAVVFVLGAQGDIFIQKPVYCDYDDSFSVLATNTAGSTGSFKLRNSSMQIVAGLIDNLDNTASITPTALQPGIYTVEYKYDDVGATLILREDFTIETVEVPKIDELEKDVFCQNDAQIRLTGSPGDAVFSGDPGVTGNAVDGYNFNPQLANLGQNTIVYTNTTVNGCFSSVDKVVTVNLVPDVQFLESDVCLTSGETIYFENQTLDKHTVSQWNWTYGDINSGEDNFGTSVEGFHQYSKPGNRTIQLVGTTPQGCSDSLSRTIDFGDKPFGTFLWTNECFLEGDSILFISDVDSENTLINYRWVFFNSLTDSTVFTDVDSVYYAYESSKDYDIKLSVETDIGCKNEFNRTIHLKPTIRVSDDGFYFEDFETDDGNWSPHTYESLTFNSWDYDVANFSADSGTNSKAWYTDVPDDIIISEQSWVISPCFNLRDIEKPMISFDIFRDMEDNEGVVLQYSINNEISWQNVGTLDQGINWFNDFTIANKPAGQEIGWSGSQDEDGWVKSVRYIDELIDKPNVRFKLHYGTNHQLGLDRKGFAFDNFKITSRSRMVLMENFTNGSNQAVLNSDLDVNMLFTENFDDVVKLEYHTDIGGEDVFNESNIFVPATRALFYGVNSLPSLIIDGGGEGLLTYPTAAQIEDLNSDVIVRQSLLEPLFDIRLDVDYGEEFLTANIQLEALDSLDVGERILQVVVFERLIDEISMANGQEFRNVVKDMIPNAAGTAYFNSWDIGETQSEQFSWSYQDVYDAERLRVAVFVQNDNTKEVYQATTDDESLFPTDVNNDLAGVLEVNVYPNPAGEFVFLQMDNPNNEEYLIEIFNNMGSLVEQYNWKEGSQLERISLDQYTQGFYLLRFRDKNGNVRAIKKLAVVK